MAFEIIDANTIFGPWPLVRADMSEERLTETMIKHNVSKSLTLSTIGALHSYGDGNAETLRICSEKEELVPVATLDPRGYFMSSGMFAKLAEQGFKMVRFFPILQSWPIDFCPFIDSFEEIENAKLPVMIQARETGFPSEIAKAVGGKDVAVILESVSFENMAESVCAMRKHENILFDTREFRVPGALRFLVDQIGAERVIFGSGSMRSSLAAAIAYVNESDISDEQKEMIFSGNIKRILGGGI